LHYFLILNKPFAQHYQQKSFDVLISNKSYKISQDAAARCFRINRSELNILLRMFEWILSWFFFQTKNSELNNFINTNLKAVAKDKYYFEEISGNKSVLDARCLSLLMQKKLVVFKNSKNFDVTIDDFPKTHGVPGYKGKLYKIHNRSLKLSEPETFVANVHKFLSPFENDYIEVSKSALHKITSSRLFYSKGKGYLEYLTGEKLVVEKDPNFSNRFRLYSIEGSEITKGLNQQVKHVVKSLIDEEPFIQSYQGDVYMNEAAVAKYSKNFIPSEQLSGFIRGLARLEEIEHSKLKSFLTSRGKNKLKESDFNDLNRVWLENGKINFRAQGDHITVSCEHYNPSSVASFQNYVSGHSAIRRYNPLTYPIMPTWRKKMSFCNKDVKKAPVLIIDGGDDIATAMSNSGLPQQTALALQSFLIFPAFLSLVNVGVQGLLSESKEFKDELKDVKSAIKSSSDRILKLKREVDEILNKINHKPSYKISEFEKGKLDDLLKQLSLSVIELKNSFEGYDDALKQYRLSNSGYAAMVSMFTAVSSFELESFSKLVSLGSNSSSATIVPNVFNVMAVSTAAIGQSIMSCYAAAKAVDAKKEYDELKENIDKIRKSPLLSNFSKKVVIAHKQDEKLFKKLQVIGNSTLSVGQGLMFAGGLSAVNPLTYAGLSATLAGVSVNTAGTLWYEKRYSKNEDMTEAELRIRQHNQDRLFAATMQSCGSNSNLEKLQRPQSLGAVNKTNVINIELLTALQAVPLAMNKILKENYKYGDVKQSFYKVFDSVKTAQRKLPEYLFMQRFTQNQYEELSKCFSKYKYRKSGYIFLWKSLIDNLEISSSDIDGINKFSEKLLTFRSGYKLNIDTTDLPQFIVSAVSKYNNSYKLEYENLIGILSSEFYQQKFDELKAKHPSYMTGNETPREHIVNAEVIDKLLEDSSESFARKLLQWEYDDHNKTWASDPDKKHKLKGLYQTNTAPLKISGQLQVKEDGFFSDTVKSKNLYELNKQYIQCEHHVEPDFVKGYLGKDQKWLLRSGVHRSVEEIDQITDRFEEGCQVSNMVKRALESRKEKADHDQHDFTVSNPILAGRAG